MKNLYIKYLLLLFFICWLSGSLLAQETVLDDFSSSSYSINKGTSNWSTDWIETNDDNSYSSGRIDISGSRLRFEDITRNSHQIRRSADLGGATSATLFFDWETDGLDSQNNNRKEQLDVQISVSETGTYTTIGTLDGTQSSSFSADISAYISSETTIRFVNTSTWQNGDWEAGEYAYVDNVQISYVTPSSVVYCSANGDQCDEFIERVQVGSIDNTNTGCSGGYGDFTRLLTNMNVGIGYPITVTNGNNYNGDQCGIWVDWNQDGDFDDIDETISVSGGTSVYTANITPPVSAVAGNTRMRIRIMWTGVMESCSAADWGEVEDYTLNVIANNKPKVTTLDVVNACAGGQVVVTGSNFNSTSSVEINNVSIPISNYVIDSDTQITITVPSGATTGLIKVINPDGFDEGPQALTINQAHKLSANITNDECGVTNVGAIDLTVDAGIHAALDFGSTNNPLDLQDNFLSNRGAFTLEGWVKFTADMSGGQHSFFGQNNVIEFGFENGSLTCWTAASSNVKYTINNYPTDDEWHHVAAVGTGNSLKLYIDGVEKNSVNHTATSSYGASTYTVKVGAGVWDDTSTNDPFAGEISVVRFWDVARTATELFVAQFQKLTGSETGLLAAYRLDEAVGSTVLGVGPEATSVTISSGIIWDVYPSPYTYVWSNGAGVEDVIGLTSGTYDVTVSIPGCSVSDSYTIGIDDKELPQLTCQADIDHILFCERNIVNIIVPNPTDDCNVQSLTYKIGSGVESSNQLANVGNTITVALLIGDNTITWKATDSGGKTSECSFTIHVDTQPSIDAFVVKNTLCATSNDGEIGVSIVPVESGIVEYYLDGTEVRTWQTSGEFLNLPAGNYNVKIRVGTCESVGQALVIGKPADLALDVIGDVTEICEGSIVKLSVNSNKDHSMKFDGLDDYLLIPNSNNINVMDMDYRSVMFWFKPVDINTKQVLYEEGGGTHGLAIYIEGGELYAKNWISGSVIASVNTNLSGANVWQHVALIWNKDGSLDEKLKLYLNGSSPVKNGNDSRSIPSHTGDIRIGNAGNTLGAIGGDNPFNGNIDEFRLWNTVLNEAQIQTEISNRIAQLGSSVVDYDFNNLDDPISNSWGNTSLMNAVVYESDDTYLWDDPAKSTASSIAVLPNKTTTYTIAKTNESGCTISKSIEIKVNPKPKPVGIFH